nr:beta-glucosidase 11-like isoform X1 [Tanacetum cinerariifolium]
DDIQLMANMGLEAFRFSISWSRLIPNGRGSINVKGLQYYNDFINELSRHDQSEARRVETGHFVVWFLNPLVNGDYPEIMKKNAGNRIPTFTKLELELIKGSFDFFGINHYSKYYIKDNPSSLDMDIRDVAADMAVKLISNISTITPTQFDVDPLAFQKLLKYLKEEYGNPRIYIHENGQVQLRNGTLMDTPRVEYLHAYIGALLESLRNGSNTKGDFVWSFMDLFELLDGYNTGYGLYYVDLDDKDLTRYPKLSAHWRYYIL